MYAMQCANEACAKWFESPPGYQDEVVNCPYCAYPVFCDWSARVEVDASIELSSFSLDAGGLTTARLELQCVGPASDGRIHAHVSANWYEMRVNDKKKTVQLIGHKLPIRTLRVQGAVNSCGFDVPQGAVCHYTRRTQLTPPAQEKRWFRMEEGRVIDMGGPSFGFAVHYPQYARYRLTMRSPA